MTFAISRRRLFGLMPFPMFGLAKASPAPAPLNLPRPGPDGLGRNLADFRQSRETRLPFLVTEAGVYEQYLSRRGETLEDVIRNELEDFAASRNITDHAIWYGDTLCAVVRRGDDGKAEVIRLADVDLDDDDD
jgi:hypothetical protein